MKVDLDKLTAIREDYWAWEKRRAGFCTDRDSHGVGMSNWVAVDLLEALAEACGFNEEESAPLMDQARYPD